MQYGFDRTGFPVVQVPGTGLWMHLLPVTKRQFEAYLAQPDTPGDAAYNRLLEVNPRPSWRGREPPEAAFVTGLLPGEAEAFAEWFGAGFAVPEAEEWRLAYVSMAGAQVRVPQRLIEQVAPGVRRWLDLAWQDLGGCQGVCSAPVAWTALTRMRDGVVEWTRKPSGEPVGRGAPAQRFQANTWDPGRDEIRPLAPARRMRYFGVRLFRKGVGS